MSDLSKLRYGSFSIEEATKEKETLNSGSNYMKLEAGENLVRFLPPAEPGQAPYTKVYQHFINRGPADRPIVFNCPKRMNGGHCPACAKADALIATGNKADKEEAMKLYPKLRVFYNVINRHDEEAGPQVLGVGKKIHEELMGLRANARAGGDFFHPIEGFDVVIEKEGTGLNTKYTVNAVRNSSQLTDKLETAQDWIDNQDDHKQQAYVPSLEEVKAKLLGEGAPAKAAPKALQATTTVVETELVEEDDDTDDLDDFGL